VPTPSQKERIDHGRQLALLATPKLGEGESLSNGPALNMRDMKRLLSAADPEGNRIIQILSAFNCRFLGPNTR
jgi:hypothetical protein